MNAWRVTPMRRASWSIALSRSTGKIDVHALDVAARPAGTLPVHVGGHVLTSVEPGVEFLSRQRLRRRGHGGTTLFS